MQSKLALTVHVSTAIDALHLLEEILLFLNGPQGFFDLLEDFVERHMQIVNTAHAITGFGQFLLEFSPVVVQLKMMIYDETRFRLILITLSSTWPKYW